LLIHFYKKKYRAFYQASHTKQVEQGHSDDELEVTALRTNVCLMFTPLFHSRVDPFSTTYIFFSKNHQSLISLCITSSVESTSCLIPSALHKTPCWWCHTL